MLTEISPGFKAKNLLVCKTPVCVLFDHKLYRLCIDKQQFHHKGKPGSRDKLCDEVMDELIFFMVDLFSSGSNSPKPRSI